MCLLDDKKILNTPFPKNHCHIYYFIPPRTDLTMVTDRTMTSTPSSTSRTTSRSDQSKHQKFVSGNMITHNLFN